MCNQCGDTGHVGLGRRGLLGTLSAGLFAGGLFAQPASAQPAGAKPVSVQPARITADAALKRLMDGHKAYMANKASVSGYGAGRAARAGGQTPIAMFLSCADSRVLPAEKSRLSAMIFLSPARPASAPLRRQAPATLFCSNPTRLVRSAKPVRR